MTDISLPDELTGALENDSAARQAFDAMPSSHRMQYAKWIQEARKPETRQQRAADSIKMIKAWAAGRKRK